MAALIKYLFGLTSSVCSLYVETCEMVTVICNAKNLVYGIEERKTY